MHGFIRGFATIGARRGDPQARMIADPAVRADPIPFYDELRRRSDGHGPLIRCRVSYLTVDHAVAHELLRSDDFRVITLGSNLPAPLRLLERLTRPEDLHPLRAAVAVGGRTARTHPLPQDSVVGVHPQSRCGTA